MFPLNRLAVIGVFLLCVGILSAGALGGNTSTQDKSKDGKPKEAGLPLVQKWEYRVADLARTNQEAEKELNKFGDEGWEVAAATSDVSAPPAGQGAAQISTKQRVVLKRPRP